MLYQGLIESYSFGCHKGRGGKPRALGGDVTETAHDMTEFDHSKKDDEDDDGRIHECDERKERERETRRCVCVCVCDGKI